MRKCSLGVVNAEGAILRAATMPNRPQSPAPVPGGWLGPPSEEFVPAQEQRERALLNARKQPH